MPFPQILAPAGNRDSFLAAIAAGADAIYCGLKTFSARMEAKNFSLEEMAGLIQLAHEKNVKVFVPINSLIKSSEISDVARAIGQLVGPYQPDALIVQDLAVVEIARNAGFTGEIHLSTLANVSFPQALTSVASLPRVRKVVLPRELTIDEIKAMAGACPENVDLEVFIHGALCYGVSGRCYWSSYFGGKSGLRGRCVQPCRRVYQQGGERSRHFSCQDLSLDTLVKVLKEIPQVKAWKIEGRKKSAHYVYYTVMAYRMLRDEFQDPNAKKAALALLEMALGRKGTHYNFLPQRKRNPLEQGRDTGSGFQLGTVKGSPSSPFLSPRIGLLSGDTLRVGYEDETWHTIIRVRKSIPRNGQFYLNVGKEKAPRKGTPVFLTDRREQALSEYIDALAQEIRSVEEIPERVTKRVGAAPPRKIAKIPGTVAAYSVFRNLAQELTGAVTGIWLSEDNLQLVKEKTSRSLWAWLPPVVWPDSQTSVSSHINSALSLGIKHFVLNAPWQMAFFEKSKDLKLWAGPFCNTANPLAVTVLKKMGFDGAFVSPELGREDVMAMPQMSPLPLGIIVGGNWPLCISRIAPETLTPEAPFSSPKGEMSWLRQYDHNYWVFPNWAIDLSAETEALQKAGYLMQVTLNEPVPNHVTMKDRAGLWNWKHDLL